MTPAPRSVPNSNDGGNPPRDPERIVISGMSGLYPNSRNIKELSEILYNKVNPVSSENSRWVFSHPEVVNYLGKAPDLNRFDAQFFKVANRLAENMDPMSRKLLETAYAAIYDAGLSPSQLNGKKIGVFVGAGLSETETRAFHDLKLKHGVGLTGVSKTMYANRISYWLNIKGPSSTMDCSCCGSTVALEQAIAAMNRGDCEAAIVGSTNICLSPQTMVNYKRCIAIAPDGKTKSFANNADGLARSDAINVIYLQKAKDALRIYAEIVGVKNEFSSRMAAETGQVFGFNRNFNTLTAFLEQFYHEVNVPPQAVEYVEAFGSASPEADKTELQTLEKVFCDDRSDPLLVGSVMSNIGYTDCASGITAITKVLFGYHKEEIAGNLHCETPRQDVNALRDGRMQIVRENQPFKSTYTAVNGFSITGVNSHVLLYGNYKHKDSTRYKSSIPRLVMVSTREQATLPKIFKDLKSRPVDPEEIALFHNIHSHNISGHLGRGYIILDTNIDNKTVCLAENSEYNNDAQRPLWFVYSGMGSQWVGMGEKLMRIPIFAAAIERCHKVLKPKGIDIVHVITTADKTIFDNILHSFVGIAAIQIGLTDILNELGLKPDKIIGHSAGELVCGYADGCLTAEETILSAYSRGRVSLDTKFIRGAMAAIGLGYEKIVGVCPPEIAVACHNGPESCTISGPADKIKEFVANLTADGVFAKEVPCSNIAYHSQYIAAAGPTLLECLSKIISEPKARSSRWLSTSVPEEQWNEPRAKFCSAEYLTNNLLNPVLFEETSRLVPSNAVLVEIAPHGLLQAILKRSLPSDCKNIPLTKRGHDDNAVFLLEALGKIYIEGFTPRIQALYPKVEFPVSTGTPHLSHHVEWLHSEEWYLSTYTNTVVKKASTCNFLISTHEEEYSYLKGNVVGGKVIYPYSAALVAVWDTLAMTLGEKKKNVSVKFHDVHLYCQPIIHHQSPLKLYVSFHRGNGRFIVVDGSTTVASGFISTLEPTTINEKSDEELVMELNVTNEEIYQNLNSRGFAYNNDFKSIHRVNENITEAEILFKNWTLLIDGLLQLNILNQSTSGKTEPCQIRELTIDVNHLPCKELSGKSKIVRANIDHFHETTTCGGVVLRDVKFRESAIDRSDISFELASPNETNVEGNTAKEKPSDEKNVCLQIGKVGDMNTLHWGEAIDLIPGIKVKVHYAGLNVTDIKKAAGIISFKDGEKGFGMDFSGCTEKGDRVMGLVKNGSVRNFITAIPNLMWPVPSHWTLEEAATVPLAYVQAFYCLNIKNQLAKNSRVLIHGGAGALGQAAISIALAKDCQVFTTVSELSKKRFLRRLFPQLKEMLFLDGNLNHDHITHEKAKLLSLGYEASQIFILIHSDHEINADCNVINNAIQNSVLDENILNSRDSTFCDNVLSATNGEGCDIVLSCVVAELRNDCLKCTAHMGTTVDTSMLQSREEYEYGMSYMTKSRSFMVVDFNSIFDQNYEVAKTLQVLISEGIIAGVVRPLTRVTYAPEQAPQAFRLLAGSRHRGRVLLSLEKAQIPVQPKIICSPSHNHVIIWKGNSSGVVLADMLIARGAKNLQLHCLDTSVHLSLKLRLWRNLGANVECSYGTLSNTEIQKLLNKANELGPVEGIYLMDTVKDSNTIDLTTIISQIDKVSRSLCPHLKYFVVTTADNKIKENVVQSRSKDGFPAKLLIISDVQKMNEDHGLLDDWTWNRLAIDAMERAVFSNHPIISAKPHISDNSSVLQKLSNITDLKLNDFSDETKLKDLHLGSHVLHLLKSYLNNSLNISLDTDDVLDLTKNKIRQLELDAVKKHFRDIKGLDTMFSYVDPDELRGTTDFVLLDTLVVSLIDDEVELKGAYMAIVPGMEGHHERFRTMCKLLKLPAIVLQPGHDFPNESPKDLALRYSKVLLKKLGLTESFYILGYEYGVMVALELAAILEAHGKTGVIFCVGGGPDDIREIVKQQIEEFSTEEALQTGVITQIFKLMSADEPAQIESALQNCSSWEERVSASMNVLLNRTSHTAQYVRGLLKSAYGCINTTRTYQTTCQKLKSKIVHLRTKSSKTTPGESSLQQYSTQPIVVHDLEAPLANAAEDLGCVFAVNRYLSEDLIKEYTVHNLCDAYAAYN